tara:strand:- start:5168 stop:5785 length:618 start_codon:yes stop_codon:yes gene_type:complete
MKNIFGDFITNLAFPYASISQGKPISNKQLIDAAVLRGSLELLKPRQKGENFASQASRALDAGLEPAKNLAEYRLAQDKIKTAGGSDFVTATANLAKQYDDSFATLIPSLSKLGKFTGTETQIVRDVFLNDINLTYANQGGQAAIERLRNLPNKFVTDLNFNKETKKYSLKEGSELENDPSAITAITRLNQYIINQDAADTTGVE